MRAKPVEFERGLDPKDALQIGDQRLRDFRRALKTKNFLASVIENMIDGLENGSISEKEAKEFIYDGIVEYGDHPFQRLWVDWFLKTANIYWNKNNGKLYIFFDMPDKDFLDITKKRKFWMQLFSTLSSEEGRMYQMKSCVLIKNEDEDFEEEVFHESNIFPAGDEWFSLIWIKKQISKVVEVTIKNT